MYEAPSDKIKVIVVCPDQSMKPILLTIKKWHLSNPLAKVCIHHVQDEKCLSSGLQFAREFPDKSILIPIGFKASDVFHSLNNRDLRNLEIIIRPPRSGKQTCSEIDEQPSASLLDDVHMVSVQDILPALRKSLLRIQLKNHVTIRELNSKDDFTQYFSLRYKIWRTMGYLPEKSDCKNIGLELNYSERTAYPVGAFASTGELIGCARLVFSMGIDSRHLPLISELVASKNDAKLTANFEYPRNMTHPFDVLDSLKGFRAFFSGLVKDNIRYAEVSRVIVSPEFRGNGLGEVLVDSLLTLARRYKLGLLFLACNENLHLFYERCGFRVLPGLNCDNFARVNAPAIAMTLDLRTNKQLNLN